MDIIQIKDKRFKTFIPEAQILQEVSRVANEIMNDLNNCASHSRYFSLQIKSQY